jgi:ribose transport system permease protein
VTQIADDALPNPAGTHSGSSGSGEPEPDKHHRRLTVNLGLDKYSALYIWAVLIILFGILEPHTFLTNLTFETVLANQALTALLTIGLTLALAAGVFDLSFAGTMTISVIMVAWLQSAHGFNPAAAIICTLLLGLLIGAVNAFLIVKLQVHGMIATLGVGSVTGAIAYAITSGNSIATGIPESFKKLGRWQWGDFAIPVVYMLILAAVAYYVLEHTPLGRYVYATGGNQDAARLSGIRTDRIQVGVLLCVGLISSATGIIFTAQQGSASVDTGSPYLLSAFAAAFLGSTQIRPGRFNVLGTLVAIFVIATGVKGLTLRYTSLAWISPLFQGAALVVAVAVAAQGARRRHGVGSVVVPDQR